MKNDVICRQAAIDTLNADAELLRRVLDDTDIVGPERAKYEWALGLIQLYILDMKELPSAQPEPCEDAVNKIKNASFTGSNGLDYVETLVALDALKLVNSSSTQPEHNPDDERKIANLHKMVNYLLSQLEQWWIPCSERLPEEKEKSYWVCTSGGYQCQARWTDDKFGLGVHTTWGWHFLDCPQYDKITAWMPLPEPYREEDDE